MNRDAVLAVVAVGLVVLAAGGAVALPGAITGPDRSPRPGHLALTELTVSPDGASGANATLAVTTYLQHRGGPAENVTVQYRAVDTDTGFVVARTSRHLGTVTGGKEVNATGRLTVEREGGYRLETLVYRNESRVASGAKTVEGMGALTPAYARSPITFHQFDPAGTLPSVSFSVESVRDNRTTLNVSAYLTNTGGAAEDVRVTFVARQADSNIVAGRSSVHVGQIDPGHTATPSTTLTVPADYNYYLDAVLWKDGVIVGSTRTAANLDPTETLHVNQTKQKIGLQVSDFEATSGTKTSGDTADGEYTTTATSTPGFGVLAALVGVFAALLAGRRWSV